MTLIRLEGVVPDEYPLLADDAPIPTTPALVPWDRLQPELAAGTAAPERLGARLANTVDVVGAWEQLKSLPLIALEFPAFPDGRAYSQARLLRDRLGYEGELRATGLAVVLDQIQALRRCGFDSFDLRADQNSSECVAALNSFSVPYQPAADQSPAILRLRRRG